MPLTLSDDMVEQCRVSGEMVGESFAKPLLTAYLPEIYLQHSPSFEQVLVTPTWGLSAYSNRAILFLHHQPRFPEKEAFYWALPEDMEEAPAPELPQPPADANQESVKVRVGAWVREATERFDYLLSLSPGWDGHEAVPVKNEHVLAAGKFLSTVMAPETAAPAIVPTADGGIQIEWHQGGVDVEVLFSDCDDDALYVHDLASRKEWEGPAVEGFSEFELASRLAA